MAPDGTSSRVTYGVINLTHRESHAAPAPLVPGKRFSIDLRLNETAQVFPAGHRIRLALSTSYWPMIWPSPERVTLRVIPVTSHLQLPIRPPRADDGALHIFSGPEGAPPPAVVELEAGGVTRRVERDLGTGGLLYEVTQGLGGPEGVARERFEAIDLTVGSSIIERYRLNEDDPLSATARIDQRYVAARGDHRVRVDTRVEMSADAERFRLEAEVRAHRGDELHWTRSWDVSVPRKLV